MDRSQLSWLATALGCVLLAACGGNRRLSAGGGQPNPKAGVLSGAREATVAARGALTYAVAITKKRLVSVELTTRFELVSRTIDDRGKVRGVHRHVLGDPTYDVHALAVDAARSEAWVAMADGTVRAVALGGQERVRWKIGDVATAVALSPDGRFVAVGTATGVVCLRRRADGALLQCMTAHGGVVSALGFAPAGPPRLASTSWDGSASLWNVPSLARVATRRGSGSANALAFTRDGKRIALGWSSSPPIRTPEVVDRERSRGYGHPDRGARAELWTPNGSTWTCRGHAGPITTVGISPKGSRLVSASWDRSVQIWKPGDRCAQIARLDGFDGLVRSVAIGPNGRFMAVGAWSSKMSSRATVLLELLYER